jgi:FMN reductase (NADPH)
VIAVADHNKREKLAKLCGDQKHIRQAPIFLAWCADLSRLDRLCEQRGYKQVTEHVESFLVSAVDATLAMQNSALAAESHGLGMCYIGAIRNRPRDVIALLSLPELVFPISGMTVGWPDVEPRVRPRLPLRTVLHWESYDTDGEDEAIREYDQAMIETGIYSGRKVSGREQNAVVSHYGWAEHSARRASLAIRTELRQILAEQGFLLQ